MKSLKFCALCLITVLYFSAINGQTKNDEAIKANSYLQTKGEVYFKFYTSEITLIKKLSKTLSIDKYKDGECFAYANKQEFEQFLTSDINFIVLPHPGDIENPNMLDAINIKGITDWDFYPTYDAYVNMMLQFQTTYPTLCNIDTIGILPSGRMLLVAKISDNVNVAENEPEFLYTSSMHGDELTGYVLMLRLINYLLSNYGTIPRVTNLVNNIEIWINPLANPDGTYAGGNSTVSGARRTNGNFVDYNRNFPDPEDGPHPDGNAWQPETIAFMEFAYQHNFTMAANFHGGIELVNYPWDTWVRRHPDNNWYIYVSREYADTAQANSPSGYFTGQNNGITNGYDWYEVDGGRQDYMNYWHHCRETCIEISNTKLPSASSLPNFWNYLYKSFLNYMEQSLYGIHGTVTDSATGEPIRTFIEVIALDADSSQIYSSANIGDYHRPIAAGTYSLKFSAPGYYTKTINNVTAANKTTTTIDVQLAQGLIAEFSANRTLIPKGGNVNFTDHSYGTPQSWLWNFNGANPVISALKNPTNIEYPNAGNFDVSLTITDSSRNHTLTKTNYIKVIDTTSGNINMSNNQTAICSGNFYDSNGPSGSYTNNENYTLTFIPSRLNHKLQVSFSAFDVEYHSSCNYDWLKIYDGINTSAPLIGNYCGTTNPGLVTANNNFGALTFQFKSDGSQTAAGWAASIECIAIPVKPTANFNANSTSIYEGDTISFTDASSGSPTSRQWLFEGGIPDTSNEANPKIIYPAEGVYDVTLIVTNAVGSDTLVLEDYINVAHNAIPKRQNTDFQIFPNPVRHSDFTISNYIAIKEVKIIDVTGKIIYIANPETKKITINSSEWNNGLYLVFIKDENKCSVKKIHVIK